MLWQFAAACGGKCGFPFNFGKWCVDLSVVVRLIGPGSHGEIGQLTEQHVQLYGAALHRNLLDALTPLGIDRRAEESQRLPWIGIGNHDWCRDEFATFEHDAFSGYYPCDRNAGGNHRSRLSRGIANIKRDHAHAAFNVTPHAGHSAQAARCVMEANAGGSCVEWAGVGANHSLPEVCNLQPFVTQIVFNEFGHRPVEEHVLRLLIVSKPRVNLFARGRLADPHIAVTCRTQGIAQSAKHVAHCTPAFDIPRSEFANFRLAPVVVVPELNAGAVEEWNEEPVDRRRPLKAALG